MKILKISLIITFAILTSCSNNNNNNKSKTVIAEKLESSADNESIKLLQQHCYACHSVISKSHDEIIAPPMVAVKRRYLRSYVNKNEFVEAMTNWVLDPKEEDALMFGAVQNFNVMPKQPINKEEIIKIATYIFDNELEKPSWFQQHFNEEHPNGIGNGNGNGMGKGQGKRRGMLKYN